MAGVIGRRFLTSSVATAGVLAGHWLTYRIHVPDPASRSAALAQTGHGYLSLAAELVTLLTAVAVASVFVGALMDAGTGARPGRALVARLSALQVGAFCAMELLERIAAGAPIGELLRGGILPVGVAANVGVALVGAAVLRWILRTADRVGATIGDRPISPLLRAGAFLVPLTDVRRRPSLLALADLPARGPPSPVRS